MKPRSRFWPTVKRTLLRLIWHGFPFVILALVVVFVIIPMGRKISAEKAELAEQQSRQVQETAEATRVITLEMVPEDLMERISLPGMARPWKSLEVVAEVAGRIMEKKMDDGTVVDQGDVLAVIDQRDYQNAYDSARALMKPPCSISSGLKPCQNSSSSPSLSSMTYRPRSRPPGLPWKPPNSIWIGVRFMLPWPAGGPVPH